MERASRLIVVASIALAIVAHGWLATWHPALGPAAILAFAIAFLVSRLSLRVALAIVLGTAYVAPALLSLAFPRSDFHLILVWLAAAAGLMFAHADLRRWHAPRGLAIPLAAWASIVAVSWPVVAGRELDFSIAAAHTFDTTQGIFAGAPAVASAFIVVFALVTLIGILWLDFLWAYVNGDMQLFYRDVVAPLAASAAIGSVAGIYQSAIDISWLNPEIWSTFNRAGGLMLDANTFGSSGAIWAPVVVAAGWAAGTRPWVGAVLCGVLTGGMWTSGSRTALMILCFGLSGVGMAVLKRRGWWRPATVRALAIAGAVTLVVALAVVPRDFESTSPIGRAFARIPSLDAQEIRRFGRELWDRFGYASAAQQMFQEHPLTGVGVGAFHVLSPDYIYLQSDGERRFGPDNAQNWWRHQVAELGVIGSLPSLGLSVLLLGLLLKGRALDGLAGVSTVPRLVLAGVGVASLFGVPTQHPAATVSVAAIVFFFVGTVRLPDALVRDRSGAWWIAVLVMAAATAAGQWWTATGDLRVARRAIALAHPYAYGVSPYEGLSEFGNFRWLTADAVIVTPIEGRWYQLTFLQPRPAMGAEVTVSVAVDGRQVLTHRIEGTDPVTYFVEPPAGARAMMLELDAQPSVRPYTVGIADRWLHDLPHDVSPDQVIR